MLALANEAFIESSFGLDGNAILYLSDSLRKPSSRTAPANTNAVHLRISKAVKSSGRSLRVRLLRMG